MFTRPLTAAALAAFALLASPRDRAAAAAPDAPYRVVVNAANPAAAATRREVGRMFLRRTQRWPDDRLVVPVDLADAAAARAVFSPQVGKSVAGVEGYWQQQLFTGHGVPPLVKASEAEVLDFVGGTAGAIGYVSAAAPLPATVRALRVVG